MEKEKNKFQTAVQEILEVVMFENWLRFYFIQEEKSEEDKGEPALRLELPEKSLAKIEALYPTLYPLAKEMSGRAIDFETSRTAVLAYIMEALDGSKMPRGEAQRVLSSVAFQTELQLFHTWLQMHEAQLDQGFADFGSWQEMFSKWQESPAAKELAENLKKSLTAEGK